MAITPQAYERLSQLDDGVDHMVLDQEAGHTEARLMVLNGDESRLNLLYMGAPFAAVTIRALDASRFSRATRSAGEIRDVLIEKLEVDPGRYHLGLLASALAVINAYPSVDHLRYLAEVGDIETIRAISLHLLGWGDKIYIDSSDRISLEHSDNLATAA